MRSRIVAGALYALWWLCDLLAGIVVTVGSACVWIAKPFAWSADWCLTRAREWDPRLWQRNQHTDLSPPPGA